MDPEEAKSLASASGASPGPETLIGQFILAHASDDRARLAVLKERLARSRWHHANSVIVTVAHVVVSLRWPDTYTSDDVMRAVRLAVAMAPRADFVNEEALEHVVQLTLGEAREPHISQQDLVTYRLYLFWAFVRQLDLSRDAIAALIGQAEREAIRRGYAPTPATVEDDIPPIME